MSQKPWYFGMSGAQISLELSDMDPIAPFAQKFRDFKFKAMQFGEVGGHLFCTHRDTFARVEAELNGGPRSAIVSGGVVRVDTNSREFTIWFSHCWGDSVEESQELLLSCLPALKTISYWKIESDGFGPDQRSEGHDLDSLRVRLALS